MKTNIKLLNLVGVIFWMVVVSGMGFPKVREARAATGSKTGVESGEQLSFKETLGTAGAVGLVLGASTLPFYAQPGSHLVNLGYGAALGLLAGVGIWMIQDHDTQALNLNSPIPCNPNSVCVPVVVLTW
ncbi:MAG: hypothetical protein ACK5QT_06240 [Oligoflexia bacterium]